MPKPAPIRLEPRKTPIQARSTASVEAIMQATIQVLLEQGRAKLTTTRVAHRAGVSVGTLYQYFPNKSSLLQALLRQHLDSVAAAIETACQSAHGAPLEQMAETVIAAFVRAKFHNIDSSAALYAVSGDVEGKRIAHAMHTRAIAALTAMLKTAPGKRIPNPELVATTVLNAITGVSRATLENGAMRSAMATMEMELTTMVRAYLEASARNATA